MCGRTLKVSPYEPNLVGLVAGGVFCAGWWPGQQTAYVNSEMNTDCHWDVHSTLLESSVEHLRQNF